jgi:lysylphosphatidylglycerol synthetase-like protein (DUF2156 family)
MSAFFEEFQKELGKRLAQAIALALTVLLSVAGFSLPKDMHTARIVLLCLAGLSLIVLASGLAFRYLSSRRSVSKSPLSIYSTLAAAKVEQTTLDPLTFHVLKYFWTFPIGSASVSVVSHSCQISLDEALDCVKRLWHLKLIKTLIPAPGEWNGQYQITPRGSDYVRNHAT